MIKNKLSEILGRERIKMSELARWTGISTSTLHRLYHEHTRCIDLDNLDKICEALECTPNDLLEYIPNKK